MADPPEANDEQGSNGSRSKIMSSILDPKLLAGEAMGCVEFWSPLGLTVIVLWLLYRPDRFHPTVDSAVLSAHHLTANASNRPTSLRYDLAIELGLRNSHRRLSIRYLDMSATAFYNGTRLGPTTDALPTPFRQGPKNTTVLHPAFRGTVAVDSIVAAELERKLAAGMLHVTVRVSMTLLYKVWLVSEIFFYDYDCRLCLPPPRDDAAPAVADGATECMAVSYL
ncbi:unnamed protein product [Urochloa decumbens]|uniref:Late embryogenesis abundant protein LEA-2 subgroup domain-containing protein n=1 Tax=Urochloa decumbens TaxID=240449 RepID=A0ABC9BU77_9POAL